MCSCQIQLFCSDRLLRWLHCVLFFHNTLTGLFTFEHKFFLRLLTIDQQCGSCSFLSVVHFILDIGLHLYKSVCVQILRKKVYNYFANTFWCVEMILRAVTHVMSSTWADVTRFCDKATIPLNMLHFTHYNLNEKPKVVRSLLSYESSINVSFSF